MAGDGNSSTGGGDRNWDALHNHQVGLEKKIDELGVEFRQFVLEMRQELQQIRNVGFKPATTPAVAAITPATGEDDLGNRNWRRPRQNDLPTSNIHPDSEEGGLFSRRTQAIDSDSEEERIPNRNRDYNGFGQNYNDCKMKIDIPFFDGHLHIEDYLDWEHAVETFFEFADIPDEQRVRYVACRLKGGAGAWWQQVQQTRRREGRSDVRSWPRLKQLLRNHFLPTDFEQLLFVQYQRCHQGNQSVSTYTEEFYRLNARNNVAESVQQTVARYISGLKENIQDKLEMNAVWTLS